MATAPFLIKQGHLTSFVKCHTDYIQRKFASKCCQSRWGYALSQWFVFQARVCSAPSDTDTNLWKCAYFNIMTVKCRFLPPLAVSHRCKLNCATQIWCRKGCTQMVRARGKLLKMHQAAGVCYQYRRVSTCALRHTAGAKTFLHNHAGS